MLVVALFIRLCSFCHVLYFRVICGLAMVVIGDFCYKTNRSSLIPVELPNLKSALTHKQFGRLINDWAPLNPDRILVSTLKGASIFCSPCGGVKTPCFDLTVCDGQYYSILFRRTLSLSSLKCEFIDLNIKCDFFLRTVGLRFCCVRHDLS